MIVVKLTGGLGNQLFQYALGRSLAIRNNVPLKLDLNWLTKADQERPYQLAPYAIEAEAATPAETRKIKGIIPDRAKRLLKIPHPSGVIVERSMGFDASVLETAPSAYLEGHWQSEKYFADNAETLRRELTLKAAPTGLNAELLKEISATEAIALHVRRGDYVSNKAANKFHGTCSMEYYQEAVALLAKKTKAPHLYIFSDDAAWTKENLILDYPTTYVTHNGDIPQEDIRLMSACQHFVIANSTFSWWGAWLCPNPDKTVIAPKVWFGGGANNPDLVPKSWLRI